LGRKGEDEFLILLSQIDEDVSHDPNLPARQTAELTEKATVVASRVVAALQTPFDLQGQKVHVEASIGISLCPGDAENAQQLFEHAYMAVSFSKDHGRGRCEIFNALIHEQQLRRLILENQLRMGLREGQFCLYYQPIVELSTRHVVGVEALLRWNHPEQGLVRPRDFLSVAEESGVIVALGEWVLREGTRQLRKWWEEGLELFLCLNISARQLLQADLPSVMLGVLGESQVDPKQVVLDIAEGIGTMMEPEHLSSVLVNLGGTGVKVAIDDFGTGSSSMKTLRLEHTRLLKIASAFVTGIPGDRQSMSICLAAIRLAGSLNMKSLAQGVETERQCNYLDKNECDMGQGFFFSHAVPPDEIPALVRQGKPGNEIIGLPPGK
ncbi:MAG: GGDEF domain-containing phosphodiesterase, partial [Candidatus Eremiobacterota bacterium]